MGEVIRVDFNSEPKNPIIACDVILNRPDLIELAIEGVKNRLIGEISYSKKGSKIIDDKLCAEMAFTFENQRDMLNFMNTYNNFVKQSDTFAFNVEGIVKIEGETYISVKALEKYGVDISDISSKGVEIHNGFTVVSESGVNELYVKKSDFKKITA